MSFVQSTAAYLWGLVNTWTGRANNAWGASRVWNSGASFESAYTSEYANARDTTGSVGGHATPGWGSGQLWSTTASQWETEAWDSGSNADSHAGASQEWKTTAAAWHTDYSNEVTAYNSEVAAYNAALAAGSGSTPEETNRTLAAGGPGGGAVWSGSSGAVTRTGHYIGVWTFAPSSSNSPNGQVVLYLRKNGVQQGPSYTTACPNGLQTTYNGWVEFDANNGDTIDLFCSSQTGSNGSSTTGTFKLIYIPTPSNPH